MSRHGPAHPEVAEIEEIFTALGQELTAHMVKEERVLFPFIESMEANARAGQPPPPSVFPSVQRPIAQMSADHDDAGVLLLRMRELSNGYSAPDDACPTYRALYAALEEFERDLHRHVHLENNVLFPRAIDMENAAAA